ncbi:hypothetical protein LOK49_LG08G01273 [Camellia lanceoleosa]|uniref:Uncharacterized protein n=1 Tax=Camellia lanceoleosa TaxID=1840588 RepID=A0ACC0GR63_9ERIC|nr:hypothetical protein LOK49_LG08G01273 [Camellia lanceoleosa]
MGELMSWYILRVSRSNMRLWFIVISSKEKQRKHWKCFKNLLCPYIFSTSLLQTSSCLMHMKLWSHG